MIKLGNIVRDVVSRFEGTAISRIEYINGCVQYGVLPKSQDGKQMPVAEYIDHQRLEVVSEGVALPSSNTGGVMRDAPRGNYRG